MDTKTFLQAILPTQGHYVLAYKTKSSKAIRHAVFDSIDEMSAAALRLDAQGSTVYHACASYVERKYWDDQKKKNRVRTVSNAGWTRSQWIDIDIGEGTKKYPDKKAAIDALTSLCTGLKIPAPTIVSSGTGLHCYWVFTRDVAKAEAQMWMPTFKQALDDREFRHDPVRTADIASVLRPAGTTHRKSDPGKPVKVLREGKPVDPDTFYGALPVTIQRIPAVAIEDEDEWTTGIKPEYPPSDTMQVAKACRAIRYFIKQNGAVEEPAWRAVIGVLKHTTSGEKAIHHWSAGDARYNRSETQAKIDGYAAAPSTCKYIEGTELGVACEKCPVRGKITSPISLGYSIDNPPVKKEQPAAAVAPPPAQTAPTMQLANNLSPETLPFWPKGYQWDGTYLHRFISAAESKTGEAHWRPFSNTLYYPFMRYETEDNKRAIRICALTEPKHNRWRTFEIEATKISEQQALAYALGAHEVLYMPKSKEDNRQYVQDVLYGLRTSGVDTSTYTSFGWYGEDFIIGNKRIRPTGKVEEIFLSDNIPSELRGSLGEAGTVDEWVRLINEIYNRPNAEPFQFVILCALAAPLVHLCNSDSHHGLPVALTGESGNAKTVTSAVACSVFGDPRRFVIQANEEGTTLRALLKRVNTFRHLPMVLDEITGRAAEELQGMLFALANGKPKLRLRSDGNEIDPGQAWATNTFVTGNLSIMRLLATSDRSKAAATQVRCFEIPLRADYLSKTFGDINAKQLVENDLLGHNYGTVGMKYLKAVVKNRKKIMAQLTRARTQFKPTSVDDTRERFYNDLVATAMVAGQIAQQLGLVQFDLKAVHKWARAHMSSLRTTRSSSLDTSQDYMQAFLSRMARHTLLTETFGGRKGGQRENIQAPQFEMLARNATKDRRMLVTVKAFKDWCREQNVNEQWLQEQWVNGGMIEMAMPRVRIGQGTSYYSVPVTCIEINYAVIDSLASKPNHLVAVGDDKKAAPKSGNP
jgi:hypothetical protein